MIDLTTTYMGLSLKSPVIAGSSGLTKHLDKLLEMERMGVGAVVLKSLFEEQIKYEIRKTHAAAGDQPGYTEADDYIRNYARSHALGEYLELIQEAKSKLGIPVIASVNCVTAEEWPAFAGQIQEAGADALELNVFALPADDRKEGQFYEQLYFDIIDQVKKQLDIPIALKISHHFSGLAAMAKKLSWTGISALVLFNRFFSPDIDAERLQVTATNMYSTPEEISTSLRWIAILSGKLRCDLCASTGVHDGLGVVKQLLAGAQAVQVCSTLYKNGLGQLGRIEQGLKDWMQSHGHRRIADFQGSMSHSMSDHPDAYLRVQFMKHFAGIE